MPRRSLGDGLVDQNAKMNWQALKVFVGSWNMGGGPPPQDLSPWIPKAQDSYEIYALGIQV